MFKTSFLIISTLAATVSMVAPSKADQVRDHRFDGVTDHRCPDWRKDANGICKPNVVVRPPVVVPPPHHVGVVTLPPIDPRVIPPLDPRVTDPVTMVPTDSISCGEGRGIVRQHGYHRVIAIDCSGDIFTYSGTKRGQRLAIDVDMDGEIVDVYSAP